MTHMNLSEARAKFQADRPRLEKLGIYFPEYKSYLPEGCGEDFGLAMDAAATFQPTLSTDPNSAIPAMLTTFIDPERFEILFAANAAAEILGEQKKGDWVTDTIMLPVVEFTGETSAYGDNNESGMSGLNANWPNFQSFHFQTIIDYGEREMARATLARINWAQEKVGSAIYTLDKFLNTTYFFGLKGLQNYGLVNDPALPAALTPAAKANGGVTWFTGNSPNASANEVYNDIIAMFEALTIATGGLVKKDSKLVLALSPQSAVALTFTNTFNVNVEDLLKKNFKNIRVVEAVQFGAQTTTNIQGVAGGNLVQLWAEEVEGQRTGFCGFTEKERAHPIIRAMSSFRQKHTSGTWGAVIRMPMAMQQMLGI